MSMTPFIVGALALATLAYLLNQLHYENQFKCPPNNSLPLSERDPSCYFSNTYLEARQLFLQKTKAAGAQLLTYDVLETYFTDVAIIWGDTSKYIIHVSGIHGPEGFAGSATQSYVLDTITNYKNEHAENSVHAYPTVVLVHALNPFGFANNRKYNEENIDLNRNFLTEQQFIELAARDPNAAGYLDVEFWLNPSKQYTSIFVFNDCISFARMVYAAVRYTPGLVKKAIVSGNYRNSRGLGFGGTALSKSAQNLISLVRTLGIEKAAAVTLVDVHTGLGPLSPPGLDTIYGELSGGAVHNLEEIFPTQVDGTGAITGGLKETVSAPGVSAVLSGYDLTVGMLTENFCNDFLAPHLPRERRLCITQEFGTVRVGLVGQTMIDENFAFNYGSEIEKKVYGDRLKDAFYVQTRAWKENVAKRGLEVFLQAFNYTRHVKVD